MASSLQLPHALEEWTDTDQAIIEELLLFDTSSTSSRVEPTTTADSGVSIDSDSCFTEDTEPHPLVYAMDIHPMQLQPVVQVAYWIPTELQYVHPHPYQSHHFVQPAIMTSRLPASQKQVLLAAYPAHQSDQLTEEERKAKHRAVQRRFVERKKEGLARVRSEAAQLEKQLQCLQLSTEQLTLEKQNSELQGTLVAPLRTPTTEQVDWLLEQECRLAEQGFLPFTDDEFSDLLKETMQGVAKLLVQNTKKLQSCAKVHVSGWTGRRLLEREELTDSKGNATMRLVISKHFPTVDVDDMANRAWRNLNNPAGYRRLFSALMAVKIVILQRINDDSIVVFKTMYNPSTGAIQHAVDLVCRIRTNDEILIISKGLSMTRVIASLQDHSGWCHSLNVLSFGKPLDVLTTAASSKNTAGPQGTCFRYNVCIGNTPEANLRYWFIEIIFIMIRFESVLVAPLFALGPR